MEAVPGEPASELMAETVPEEVKATPGEAKDTPVSLASAIPGEVEAAPEEAEDFPEAPVSTKGPVASAPPPAGPVTVPAPAGSALAPTGSVWISLSFLVSAFGS